MKYDDFIKWALSASASTLDYDKVYNLQCVDLIKWYIKKVRGIAPESIGDAIDYYKKCDGAYIKKVAEGGGVFKLNSAKKSLNFSYEKGDIIVFSGGKCGHIAIYAGIRAGDYISVYDTNHNGKHTTTALHKYDVKKRPVACVIRMSNTYTQIKDTTKYFRPNATVLKHSVIYCDMKCTQGTGEVYEGERVRVHFTGSKLCLIQYSVNNGYKVGLLGKGRIKQD